MVWSVVKLISRSMSGAQEIIELMSPKMYRFEQPQEICSWPNAGINRSHNCHNIPVIIIRSKHTFNMS